jgi:hypothetical protein
MGASLATQTITNETLNDLTVKVCNKYSQNSNINVDQSNTFKLSGSRNKVGNITQVNTSTITLNLAQTADTQAQFQNDISATLTAALSSTSGSVAVTNNKQELKTTVKNIVKQTFSNENIQAAQLAVKQRNEIMIRGSDNEAGNIDQSNANIILSTMINSTSTKVLSAIGITSESQSTATAASMSFFDILAKGFADGITSLIIGVCVILVVLIITAGVVIVNFLKYGKGFLELVIKDGTVGIVNNVLSDPKKIATIGGVIAAFIVLIGGIMYLDSSQRAAIAAKTQADLDAAEARDRKVLAALKTTPRGQPVIL